MSIIVSTFLFTSDATHSYLPIILHPSLDLVLGSSDVLGKLLLLEDPFIDMSIMLSSGMLKRVTRCRDIVAKGVEFAFEAVVLSFC